jgi:hypothetical protein
VGRRQSNIAPTSPIGQLSRRHLSRECSKVDDVCGDRFQEGLDFRSFQLSRGVPGTANNSSKVESNQIYGPTAYILEEESQQL